MGLKTICYRRKLHEQANLCPWLSSIKILDSFRSRGYALCMFIFPTVPCRPFTTNNNTLTAHLSCKALLCWWSHLVFSPVLRGREGRRGKVTHLISHLRILRPRAAPQAVWRVQLMKQNANVWFSKWNVGHWLLTQCVFHWYFIILSEWYWFLWN